MTKIQVNFDEEATYILKNIQSKMQFKSHTETLHFLVKNFDINKLEQKEQMEVPNNGRRDK